MLSKMQHVKGSIAPANAGSVTGNTGYRITTEMIRNRLIATLLNPNESMAKWDKGTIDCDTHTETNGGGRPAAMDFITRLYNVVTAPGIKELGLQGEFMLTVEGAKEPVVFKVEVKDNNVFYQQAELTFADPTPFMEKTEDTSHA